jgi:hypothetical protein
MIGKLEHYGPEELVFLTKADTYTTIARNPKKEEEFKEWQ